MLRSITLDGFLSFGWEPVSIELRPLNVLIGPNTSGKSNFIAALSVLHSAPTDIERGLRSAGGLDLLHKGQSEDPVAGVTVTFDSPNAFNIDGVQLRYALTLGAIGQHLLSKEAMASHAEGSETEILFDTTHRPPYILVRNSDGTHEAEKLDQGWQPTKSLLAQRRDSFRYPEVTGTAEYLSGWRFYSDWVFGRNCPLRLAQKADLPADELLPDASNFALVLNAMQVDGEARKRVHHALSSLYPGFERFHIGVAGGVVTFSILEGGDREIPSTRLSDGTLRFLALLAVLCHPKPPPLVCIEEPELGLHPDMMNVLAEVLRDAATRTQVVVTTHSDALVDAFTPTPEDVVVCERDDGGTTLRRLDSKALATWLEDYGLGRLWRRGDLGGNRW